MSLLIELLIYAVMLVLQMAIDLITLAVAEGLMAVLHRMAAGRWPERKTGPSSSCACSAAAFAARSACWYFPGC